MIMNGVLSVSAVSRLLRVGRGMGLFTLIAAAVVASSAPPRAHAQTRNPDIHDLAPARSYATPQPAMAVPVPLPAVGVDPDISDYEYPPEHDFHNESAYDFSFKTTNARPRLVKTRGGLYGALGHRAAGWRRSPRLNAAWLSAPSNDPWVFGARNWRYTADNGLDVTLGSAEAPAPLWGGAAQLGGVVVSQSPAAGSRGAASSFMSPEEGGSGEGWSYSAAVGALDYSPEQQGDLVYGPSASSAVLRYGIGPQLAVESQVEIAPGLLTSGFGGYYDTQGWGVWSAGIARGAYGANEGWRYQTAYEAQVLDDLRLSWVNERRTAGYVDLSQYRELARGAQVRNEWAATIPLGRWGDVSGVYENTYSELGDAQRKFGLTQQFKYSPNLSVALKAQKEIMSGDYDVGLHFMAVIY